MGSFAGRQVWVTSSTRGSATPPSAAHGPTARLRMGAISGVVCMLGLACAAVASASPAFIPVHGSPFATDAGPFSVAFSPSGRLLATANLASVSIFSVDPSTYRLREVQGSPFADSASPDSAVFSPNGRLLAAASSNGGGISVFTVNPQSHALKRIGHQMFSPFDTAFSVAFSPDGGLLAASYADERNQAPGSISVFSVNPGTHALREVPGSPLTSGVSPVSVAFSADGRTLASANSFDNTVSVFSVDPTTHMVSQAAGSPYATGIGPSSVAFGRLGDLLATANVGIQGGSGDTSLFSVDPSTHALTQLASSPFSTGVHSHPASVAFSPAGTTLATANSGNNTASVYAVDPSTHVLTQVAGSPFSTGKGPDAIAFSPNGQMFATANTPSNTVSLYATHRPLPSHTTLRKVRLNAKQRTAVFSFRAHAASGFQCRLIGPGKRKHSVFGSCRPPKRYSHLVSGHYTFLVRGVNPAGVDPHLARRSFTV